MNRRTLRRLGGGLTTAAIAATMLASTAAGAAAEPLATQTVGSACEVTGGTMQWGIKASFRSYISGSIANGSWETSDGLTYESPNFTWSGATGSIDPASGTGTVSFPGTVHFTGHDGILDLTLANPTIEFEGDGKAALLLDSRSTDMDGEVAVDEDQEWVGDVTVAESLAPADGSLTLTDLPTELTNSGVVAFAGFYEAGVELDPITLDLQLGDCAAVAAVAPPAAEIAPGVPVQPGAAAAAPAVPWAPITVAGVAIFVTGLTIGLLIGGRRQKNWAAPEGATQSAESTAM